MDVALFIGGILSVHVVFSDVLFHSVFFVVCQMKKNIRNLLAVLSVLIIFVIRRVALWVADIYHN